MFGALLRSKVSYACSRTASRAAQSWWGLGATTAGSLIKSLLRRSARHERLQNDQEHVENEQVEEPSIKRAASQRIRIKHLHKNVLTLTLNSFSGLNDVPRAFAELCPAPMLGRRRMVYCARREEGLKSVGK